MADFRSSVARLRDADPIVSELISEERDRKEHSWELIASENCSSLAVREACGSIMTDKYCEGYPGKRYYGGCVYYDEVEKLAIDRACQMFGVEAANVQPHSGANANMAVIFALLNPGDTLLGPRLDHGGHLTHGCKVNFSGKYFNAIGYGVNAETGLYEEEEILRLAREHRPKLVICGASAYPRQINFAMFRRVADEVGALLMADIAHYAGLIVGGVYESPVPFADVVTSTTHKTLRGPRGGIILSSQARMKDFNKMVFPGLQGGPLMHQIAGKAVAFGEALQPSFNDYARNVLENSKCLAQLLTAKGFNLLTGGTDSHMMVLDFRGTVYTGKQVEEHLGKAGITVNKNAVPNDPNPPTVTSGVRIGTAALTSRGFNLKDMEIVAECIARAIRSEGDEAELIAVRQKVKATCQTRPLYEGRE